MMVDGSLKNISTVAYCHEYSFVLHYHCLYRIPREQRILLLENFYSKVLVTEHLYLNSEIRKEIERTGGDIK